MKILTLNRTRKFHLPRTLTQNHESWKSTKVLKLETYLSPGKFYTEIFKGLTTHADCFTELVHVERLHKQGNNSIATYVSIEWELISIPSHI